MADDSSGEPKPADCVKPTDGVPPVSPPVDRLAITNGEVMIGTAPEAPAVGVPIDFDVPRLVADYAEVLYRYAYRLTGLAADAEDLTQQTFLIAHQKLSQLRDSASVRGWLFAVLRHAYLKSQRKSRRLPLTSAFVDIEAVPDDFIDNFNVDRELLQAAIDELSEPFKLVVLSYYFEDLSYREIAEQFALPVGTVMSRLSRAKNQLRSRLLEPECTGVAAQPATASHRRGDS